MVRLQLSRPQCIHDINTGSGNKRPYEYANFHELVSKQEALKPSDPAWAVVQIILPVMLISLIILLFICC